jgi:hypothetical protein
MPQYQKYAENWTLVANTSAWGYWLTWENIPGVGPERGSTSGWCRPRIALECRGGFGRV